MKAIHTQLVVALTRPEASSIRLDPVCSWSFGHCNQNPPAKPKLLSFRTTVTCIRQTNHVKCRKKDESSSDDSSSDSVVDECKRTESQTWAGPIRSQPPTDLHSVGSLEFGGHAPPNKLKEIIWNKCEEVTEGKKNYPISSLEKDLVNAPPPKDFKKALEDAISRTGSPALIAEVKKASPSKGIIRTDFDHIKLARDYERSGAACISVLTDEKYFLGSFDYLKSIRDDGVKCPLLCKDFIVDEWQLYYARTKGADAVLLIASVLPDDEIKKMLEICKTIGLAALVEVHDENEMIRMLSIDEIELLGINNRNLKTFEVNISTSKKLLEGEYGKKLRQKDILVVESGLSTPNDIAYVQNAGVKAVLIGESILKYEDPREGIKKLYGKDIWI